LTGCELRSHGQGAWIVSLACTERRQASGLRSALVAGVEIFEGWKARAGVRWKFEIGAARWHLSTVGGKLMRRSAVGTPLHAEHGMALL